MSNSGRKGAAMFEFAVVILLFMVLMIGIIDWSITFFIHQTLTWRVSEAVRYGAVYGIGSLTTIPISGACPLYGANLDSNRVAEVKNIVLCGSTTCPSSNGIFGITANDVSVQLISNIQDTEIYTNCAPPRPHVLVTVGNYRIRQWTPWIGQRFTGKPIKAGRTQECNEPACNTY